MFAISFTPRGDWFVFDSQTGKTLRRGFPNKSAAAAWAHMTYVQTKG